MCPVVAFIADNTIYMDPSSTFNHRLAATWPFLLGIFAAGFVIAIWDPNPKLIITVALGISAGLLVLGPYATAALYGTRLEHFLGGHLRLPACVLLALTAVLIADYLLHWPPHQFVVVALTAMLGTVCGHDATVAVLELGSDPTRDLDVWMVVIFPLIAGVTILAGYCSLGFGVGTYHAVIAFAC